MIDLRSDVLGPISADVLGAFSSAAAQRAGFGRSDCAEESALAKEAAALFGFEDALFVPTGTMANQIAVRLWCAPGEAIVADHQTHLVTNEAASAAGINGVHFRLIAGERGHIAPEQLRTTLAEPDGSAGDRRIRLVWLENTHNRAGGTIMPATWQAPLADICRQHRLPLHIDGARIWNAIGVNGTAPGVIAHGAASMMTALNKIVGAPAGALLLGERGFIDEAARVQKMFGGLWRPAGLLAAAARQALREWPARVQAVHELARIFATRLGAEIGPAHCPSQPETNIVMIQLRDDTEARALAKSLVDRRLLVSPYRDGKIRCVFHTGISPGDAARSAERFAASVAELPRIG
jgi:threonine aldolase